MPPKFPLTHLLYNSGYTNQGTGKKNPAYSKLNCLTENIIASFGCKEQARKKGNFWNLES